MKDYKKDTRYPENLYHQIEAHRQSTNFSKWIREAAIMRLEKDQGLTNNYTEELSKLNKEILSLGRNLNQIAKAANTGLPVNADKSLLLSIGKSLREAQANILEVRRKLL